MAMETVSADVIWDLSTIARLRTHEDLRVESRRLYHEDRWLPGLRRRLFGDSRWSVASHLERDLRLLRELHVSYRTYRHHDADTRHRIATSLNTILELLPQAQAGLDRLSQHNRYQQDANFELQLSRIKQNWSEVWEEWTNLHIELDLPGPATVPSG